jgi:hypothetical protein
MSAVAQRAREDATARAIGALLWFGGDPAQAKQLLLAQREDKSVSAGRTAQVLVDWLWLDHRGAS